MHIVLKNKKILFHKYRIKCAIGKSGIKSNKIEGDKATPRGTFRFKSIFFRKDRLPLIKTNLSKKPILKFMGWCDDAKSKYYNKIISFPFKDSAEKLYRKDNIYDIVLILNYNMNPIRKNKGSAIFLHLASKRFKPTLGCVAVSKKDMRILLQYINKKTKFTIV